MSIKIYFFIEKNENKYIMGNKILMEKFMNENSYAVDDIASFKKSPVGSRQLALRVIPMPADCNANGDIFGGWIMAQVDLAGSVLPLKVAKGRVVTVAVNEFIFKERVFVGDVLSFFATIKKIGNTSITVDVEVYAERERGMEAPIKVTQACLTYVAIDQNNRPCSVLIMV